MPDRLLTQKDIAEIFNTTKNRARLIMSEHGVNPIDLGYGKGNGLRWAKSAVIKVLDTLHAEAQQRKGVSLRKPRVMRPLRGKSVDELYDEFNKANAPIQ